MLAGLSGCIIRPRAKRVVQLFMAGGASHVDTFDYKPRLLKRARREMGFRREGRALPGRPRGDVLLPLELGPHGECGKMLERHRGALGRVRRRHGLHPLMVGKTGVHSQATYLQATGFRACRAFPAWAAWVSYGLGCQREPADVRRPARSSRLRVQRPEELGAGFLPAQHQGTILCPGPANPIADLFPPAGHVSTASETDDPCWPNSTASTAAARPGDSRLDARIRSYELAARMQLSRPGGPRPLGEPAHVLKMYGLDETRALPTEINAQRKRSISAASA